MKILKTYSFALILTFILLYGCQQSTQEITELERIEIEESIRDEINNTITDINNHDVDKMMQHCWNDNDFLYAADGHISYGWDVFYKEASSFHLDSLYRSFTLELDKININVIRRDMVIVVASGELNNLPSAEGAKSSSIAVTWLMELKNNKWVTTVGHESTDKKVF